MWKTTHSLHLSLWLSFLSDCLLQSKSSLLLRSRSQHYGKIQGFADLLEAAFNGPFIRNTTIEILFEIYNYDLMLSTVPADRLSALQSDSQTERIVRGTKNDASMFICVQKHRHPHEWRIIGEKRLYYNIKKVYLIKWQLSLVMVKQSFLI